MIMRLLIATMLCCSIWNTGNAQTPTFDWAFNIGVGGSVYTRSMVMDNPGNFYTIGDFNWGPIDFDPGPDSLNIISAGQTDIYVSKLDAKGSLIWAKSFGGTEGDRGAHIAVDDSGNVYFTGHFAGTADFDPGPGVFNLTSTGGDEIFVCKLDPGGNFLWAKQMGSTSADVGAGIATDADGNVYVTGYFVFTADFDPDSETSKLTSNGGSDIFICKFNTSGVFQWVKQIGSTGQDHGQAMVIDNASNLFLTGSFNDTVDFNPGAGVYELMTTTNSYAGFVLKLNALGDFVWATKLAAGLDGNAITLDAPGNIYVGGGGEGIAVVKLNATGNITWSKLLSGSNCNAHAIAVDANGNVYSTGDFRHTLDFDPGADSVFITSYSGWDSYINKFDAAGNYVWAYQIGAQFHDHGTGIALDASGNIYSMGHFRNTIDVDPGPDSVKLISQSYDSYLLKWNQTTVGIKDNSNSESLSIYPNPASSEIQIKNEKAKGEFRIYDIHGKMLLTETINAHNQTIDIQSLKPGIYIWQMKNRKGKLLVQ
jgi:hypothetical protein